MFARIAHELVGLRADQRGTVAVMMAFLLPILVGGLGLGFEVSNWYLKTRWMQNAADSAAIAAASNGGSNYDVEAKAVAAQYGFVGGSDNVTVTVSNTAACPAGGNTCYSVTITKPVPLFLSQVVGYSGNTTVDGARGKTVSSAAVAQQTTVQQPLCLLGLDTTGTAIRANGGPKTDFTGCSIMSNSNGQCNGSDLKATYGLAHKTSSGCGNKQDSNVPIVTDPYSGLLASNKPTDTCSQYPQLTKKGSKYSGGTPWKGSQSLSGDVIMCGDVQLTGDVTIDAPTGATIFIENGQLDLNGYTLSTAPGSGATIVFTGVNGSYTHAPTDNTTGGTGVLNIQAPTSGPWSGVALYQDPSLTTGVDVTYKGNNPTWDLTGLVYLPNASVTVNGAVNKSSNGADCLVMVAHDVLVDGTGSFYPQSPNGSGCKDAGLNMPTATIPGRAKLVY